MEITRIISYRIAGKDFATPEKAFAHVDELIAEHVRKMFAKSNAPYSSIIACTEYVLENRQALAELLAIEPFQNNDE